MRIFLFLLIVSSCMMCTSKSKIVVQEEEAIKYNVLLTEEVAIATLKDAVKHEIIDAKRINTSENLWAVLFKNEGKKSNFIKRDLLNLEFVIRVYTQEESVDNKTSKISPKKEIQKQ